MDSSCKAACWLSLIGESGEAGDGCKRAFVKSRAAAMAASVEEEFGIETFVETRQLCLRCVPRWFRESRPGNNGNGAWLGLSTSHRRHAVTTCHGAKAFRERERGCRVVPEACG